ncbi:ATP-dependent DNA helicase SRS2-like protein At4g25120 isoform X5 [Physcomitrium patens]|uniref:ATP-dependent DNA helicase SRS2-like protein At4g25120 isoform X5 n=1 Tax=Physcomitrium patens TaxID=3218 RepID=UPI000D16313D|nr:ATP-dependent DNA helicase SRS2-like protein At4g25120 isoform X3 [Physcomitrium patens]|eukprot:XP_024395416.1 ATP-dependent DNA helicase SRS2-like protein At4g25120 isoform X3 [Physcomitrella patens]
MSTGSSARLSEQQQRRITDNFRAAKAKLAQKRPYPSSPSCSVLPLPANSCNVENEHPMQIVHGEWFPQTSSNFRSPTPAKRMCNLTLPDRGERTPLQLIPANNILVSPQSGASLNTSSTCCDFVEDSSGGSCKMPALFQTSVSDVSSKECPPGEREFEYVLPGDICEDFDEDILQELDEICKKQSKHPTATTAECIESSSKLAPGLCSTALLPTVQDPVVQHLDSHHGLKMQPSQGSASVACSTVTEPSSVSSHMPDHKISADVILGGEPGFSRDRCLNELPVLGDGVLATQYSTADYTTTVTGIPHDSSKSISSPPKVNFASYSVSVVSPLTAQSTDKTTCDAELPDHLKKLNDSQREAALSDTLKPLLILAGPGSGKTSTMVARLLTLLTEGIEAKCILAMTFTTAAATEMRQRVAVATGKAISKELTISTFHSFCLQLCRAHVDKLGRSAEFLVYGHGQQRRAVIEATRLATIEIQTGQGESAEIDTSITEGSVTDSNSNPSMWKDKAKKWQQFVTQAKSAGRTSLDYEKMGNAVGASVLRHYEATLAACDAMDYHDFISFAVFLLEKYPEVLDECQKTWTCVLVDEFQDTSRMQYRFLRLLASHNRVTIVGDDDQSIFSFNGANARGFDSFRRDFPMLKEVRLHQNYRSTRSIVEAATSLIQHNKKRCQEKQAHTLNDVGEKIAVMECRTEAAECSFVVDSILTNAAGQGSSNPTFGGIAVLYRRQVTGRMFQSAFRSRKIPFNVHGVAFYRKKIIKSVISMLRTVLPGNTDIYWRRVLKALYSGDKSECKKIIEYVDKVAKSSNTSFHQAAQTIFTAKVSGTFSRKQLALGRRVLTSVNMVHCLAHKVERSLSGLVTAVVNLLPQRPVFNSRAVVDEDGGKLLNEDDDPRTVLEYFLDDVSEFLSNFCSSFSQCDEDDSIVCGQVPQEEGGCLSILKAFLDHLSSREAENFQQRKQDNKNSVTLTTMHQSKGLEWDTVYIVKANDTETPLLNEGKGQVADDSCSIEEERRLFYVAMTRARKKLYICYVVTDSLRQVLQPSRFLKELPRQLLHFQGESEKINVPGAIPDKGSSPEIRRDLPCDFPTSCATPSTASGNNATESTVLQDSAGRVDLNDVHNIFASEEGACEKTNANRNGDLESVLSMDTENGAAASMFLRGFNMEARSTVAALFNSWARKPAFQDPKRLLSKVGFVVDERLRNKKTKNKEVLIALKCCLRDDAALAFATNAIKWGRLPPEERALFQAERQEHFQQQSSERSMSAAAATSKQIAFLRSLGCTTDPTSRLHASKLIEQYKRL